MIELVKRAAFPPLLLLVVFSCGAALAQEKEQPEKTGGRPPASVYANLVFSGPKLVTDGLDSVTDNDFRIISNDAALQTASVNNIESIRQYKAVIDELELEGGAWGQGLAQELTALGSLHQQQGTYLEAVEVYTRAMHVSRVNYGLDNLEQVPVVEQLIGSHVALGQWEKADQLHSYLYYTQKKAFGANDPRMIPVLDRLAKWSLSVFNVGYGEAVGLRLLTAFYSFRAASDIVSTHFGEEDERFVNYLRDMAATAYLVARNPALMEEATRPEYRNVQDMFEDKINQIDGINPSGYADGLKALERIVARYADKGDAPVEHAQALTGLADWYLLFDRRRTAAGYYRDAFNILSEQENNEELIQNNFGEVKLIPELTANILQLNSENKSDQAQNPTSETGVIDVSFDVTSYGAVTNFKMLTEETDNNSRVLTALRRNVRNRIFRPRVVAGKMERTRDNHFRYRYWY
ncbi:MAG: hypothetical protein JKY98_12190 [Gammaproteobacteria bacterium]|nr:hypothetical protein [Gammaproteobacteria bacterium]